MSTVSDNSDQSNASPNPLPNPITNTCIHSDSINETSTAPASVGDDNGQSSTWIDSLVQLDLALSGSLLRLCHTFINLVLLSLGLYYGTKTCRVSNPLAVISILMLIIEVIGLVFILLFFIRNWPLRHTILARARRSVPGYVVRIFLQFLIFICICIGIGYVFTSKTPINNDCEILRFYFGIVCYNTWISILTRPPSPSLPVRRLLIVECIICLFTIVVYSICFGFVASAVFKTQESACTYTHIEDLYFGAPLKSFAYIGFILIGCTIGSSIFNAIFNQLFYRLPNLRRAFVHLSAIYYVIIYLISVAYTYYFSVGAILLFRPRFGGSCGIVAHNLYKTLQIWQLITFFSPLIIWLLLFVFYCVGASLVLCFMRCLPASIVVPALQLLFGDRLQDNSNELNPNPPATPGTIDALPMVVFGQVSDEFNQTECTICRGDYEVNEKVKRLPCGHLFHATCVARWLSVTRVCPICRGRITSTRV